MDEITRDLERSARLAQLTRDGVQRQQIALDLETARERVLSASKRADRQDYRGLHHLCLTALAAVEDALEAVAR